MTGLCGKSVPCACVAWRGWPGSIRLKASLQSGAWSVCEHVSKVSSGCPKVSSSSASSCEAQRRSTQGGVQTQQKGPFSRLLEIGESVTVASSLFA